MEKDYILSVAQAIRTQLVNGTDINVINSWGSQHSMATVFHDKPALAFFADARLFKGLVIIALNSSDLYEVYLVNRSDEKLVSDEVYHDMLGDTIDRAIERGDNEEEYDAFCRDQLKLLLSQQ